MHFKADLLYFVTCSLVNIRRQLCLFHLLCVVLLLNVSGEMGHILFLNISGIFSVSIVSNLHSIYPLDLKCIGMAR